MTHGQSVDLHLHVELVHFACEIFIMGEGGVKNRRISHTEIWSRGQYMYN
jgi:hypothetical protein